MTAIVGTRKPTTERNARPSEGGRQSAAASGGDVVGDALRTVYDDTLDEDIPAAKCSTCSASSD